MAARLLTPNRAAGSSSVSRCASSSRWPATRARISDGLAERRASVRRSIHNFRLVAEELGNKDAELTGFIDSSNAVLQVFAEQEASIRAALRELPPPCGRRAPR